MKKSKVNGSRSRLAGWWVCLPALVGALLLCAPPLKAATVRTSQLLDITLAVLDPGQWSFPGGNVHVRGMSLATIHLSADPLINGRLVWVGDFIGDANGDGILIATWIHEVGTWTGMDEYLADPVNSPPPVFTPAPDGAVIVGSMQLRGNIYTGAVHTQSACVGHGISGQADGVQVQIEGGGVGGVGIYTLRILDPHARK